MPQQIQGGREREMGDSSDSVSVDMEGISFGGKVPAFLSFRTTAFRAPLFHV
jgi:hypothetical protein